jgi:hypothetical protein
MGISQRRPFLLEIKEGQSLLVLSPELRARIRLSAWTPSRRRLKKTQLRRKLLEMPHHSLKMHLCLGKVRNERHSGKAPGQNDQKLNYSPMRQIADSTNCVL